MRRGFTIIELLVVIALLMVLAGSIGVGVSTAQKNARKAKATATTRELTNAILAYENANKTHELPQLSGVEATESSLQFLLGKGESGVANEKIQVLFNADMRNGKLYDPWGTPYRVLIRPGSSTVKDDALDNITTTTYMPNFYRLTADEEEVTR